MSGGAIKIDTVDSLKTDKTRQKLTIPELLLILTATTISFVILNAFILDILGFTINTSVIAAATVIEAGALVLFILRKKTVQSKVDASELLGFLIVVGLTTAYMIYPSLPALIPPSHHYDAVHPVVLSDYIYEKGALPHDYSGLTPPYYPPGYPVGGALTVAVVAHWLNRVPIDTLHPFISFVLGLTAGLMFLLVRKLIPAQSASGPIAFLATFMLFTAWEYFPGSLNERYFFGQTFAQFFALLTFFYLIDYVRDPDLLSLFLIFTSLATVLFSHPSPFVAPSFAMMIILLFQIRQDPSRFFFHSGLMVLGFGLLIISYVLPRWAAWAGQTGYGEAAPLDVETIGLVLPILGSAGLWLGMQKVWRNKIWFVVLMLAAILVQPVSLWMGKFFIPGVGTYYFEKSVYLLIYPLAILAAIAITQISVFVARLVPIRFPGQGWSVSFPLALIILVSFPPRPFAPITEPEVRVAEWARTHLDLDNLGVVSPIREDAYWVRVAIFKEDPSSELAVQAYNIGSMDYAEWRDNPDKPDYALVRNLSRTPRDPAVQTIYQYGESGILLKPREMSMSSPSPQRETLIKFGDLFDLIGYDVTEPAVPGLPMAITFYWRPLRWNPTRVSMFVQILDSNGNVPTRSEREMFQQKYPTQRWPVGVVVTDTWTLNVDQDAPPGQYTFEVAMFDKLTGTRLQIKPSPPGQADQVQLGPFHVAISAPSNEELSSVYPTNTRFGNGILLRGYVISNASTRPGSYVRITLYWQCIAPSENDYTVFIHLIESSGKVVLQIDSPPQNGTNRTNTWQPGAIIKDPYRFVIPNSFPAGTFQVEVGLYTPNDLKRVTVADSDHFVLAQTVSVK